MDPTAQFAESIIDALIQLLRTVSPFLFGLLFGMLIRKLMGAALIVAAMFMLALVLGLTSPSGIEGALRGVADAAYQIAETLGLANVQFSEMFVVGAIIGFIIGSIKWFDLIMWLIRRRRRANDTPFERRSMN